MIDSPFAVDWVAAHAAVDRDAPAIGDPTHGWTTYGELVDLMAAMVGSFAEAGVVPGDFVVHSLPSSATSVAVSLAVQALGACCVEVNRGMGTDGLAAVVAQTEAKWLVMAPGDLRAWSTALRSSTVLRVWIDGSPNREAIEQVLGAVAHSELPHQPEANELPRLASPSESDMAFLVYTSGSTGAPRAVIQTHANIAANTGAIARYLELSSIDRAMATLPLYYCYGRSVLNTHLYVGASVFFDHRFMYPRVVIEEMAAQRCSGFAGVPLTFETLKRSAALTDIALPSLRYVTQAGGAMHPDTVRWARDAFAPAVLFVMYGQTEATARLTYLPPDQADEKRGSVGRAVDNVMIDIVDDDGNHLPVGSVGNVVATGPSITPGYFRAPDETDGILRGDQLWTGDLGRLDGDGYLYIEGRTKEFIKLAGNRVSPVEIEQALAVHPDVESVAVAGFTDGVGAEHAVAFVVRNAASDVDEAALRRFCRSALAAYKVPDFVRFVDALPTTSAGKLARGDLQKWIQRDGTIHN